ncbi:hypothetical protein LSAT2_007022 [Lamellibrachia satsuma]|nr:hypothetical protein LSAT2_007022 [Lamellibrachia satsuma]
MSDFVCAVWCAVRGNFFTGASSILFRATHNRVFFRRITILVPKSWQTRANYEAATTETFNTADVLVDGAGLESMNTQSYGICGVPGEFIQIPVGYMQAPLSTIIEIYGTPGNATSTQLNY